MYTVAFEVNSTWYQKEFNNFNEAKASYETNKRTLADTTKGIFLKGTITSVEAIIDMYRN